MGANRIAEARRARGWSQRDLAERLHVTQQAVARYESGERDLRSETLVSLSRELGVTVAYLMGLASAPEREARDPLVEVPLLGAIAAGTPIEMIQVDERHPILAEVADAHPDAFLLKVRGESMNRILPDGCYALVDPCDTIDAPGKPYAVCVDGQEATIKRVRPLENGLELMPDSTDPTFKPVVLDYGAADAEEVTVIGRVVWHTLPARWDY